jgi:hypothetical protein
MFLTKLYSSSDSLFILYFPGFFLFLGPFGREGEKGVWFKIGASG